METVIKYGAQRHCHQTTQTAKQYATAEIVKHAAALQGNDQKLSAASARVLARKQHQDLAEMERDPDAHLSLGEFAAKKQEDATLAKLGFQSWKDGKYQLAKGFAAAKGISINEATALVEKIAPNVCALAER